jgi:hypothetical protein
VWNIAGAAVTNEELRDDLTEAVVRLSGSLQLAVVDLTARGMAVFRVWRDVAGTPRAEGPSVVLWEVFTPEDGRAILQEPHTTAFVIDSSPSGPAKDAALSRLVDVLPPPRRRTTGEPDVSGMLKEIISGEPLRGAYDLVALRQDPDTGRLDLSSLPLFPLESRRGDTARVDVRCEPTGGHGTAFAVVSWLDREPNLVSVQSAVVEPGGYRVTAELVRPGRVRFSGVPGLAPDRRDWAALLASVPERLDPPPRPAHLICAVEVSGSTTQVTTRLSRVGQAITVVAGERRDGLLVSLVAYGSHPLDGRAPGPPVQVCAWQSAPDGALRALKALEQQPAGAHGAPHAAQLEDMLAEVADRLHGPGRERTVLLTVGLRRPHPPRTDPSKILPCPHRHDWDQRLRTLEEIPDMSLVMIRDRPAEPAEPIWRRLGRDGLLADTSADIRTLSSAIGLAVPPAPSIPFPLIPASPPIGHRTQ